MKDFDDFRKFMLKTGDNVESKIQSKVNKIIDEDNIDNLMVESHLYTRIAIMEVLSEYHKWLNS